MATAAPARLCFHCGQPGHKANGCPSPAPQSEAGKEAFNSYLNTRQRLAEGREERQAVQSFDGCLSEDDSAAAAGNGRSRAPLHHFHRVVDWMEESALGDGAVGGDGPAGRVARPPPLDPVSVLRREAADGGGDGAPSQRWRDLHNARRRDLHNSYRELFRRVMERIRHRLASELGVSESDERASAWGAELSRAVKYGRPADFSAEDGGEDGGKDGSGGGGRCLKVYTVEKLSARCRQLHHLMFDDNPYSSQVRSILLPLPASDADGSAPVKVLSLGGGPGYDHLALCMAAQFLHRVQPHRAELRTRRISTQVFDLFDDDWRPVLTALGECCHEGLGSEHGEGGVSGNNSGRSMTICHADLRLGLDDPVHSDRFVQAVESSDIVSAQFVLHENASYILTEDGQRIGGAVGDILRCANEGTLMFCTDSVNTLWPALKATAVECGWQYLGDEERKKIVLGPKSFVMLQRTERV